MRRGEIWWVEFDERRPVVLLSEDEPSGFRAMQVVAPADTDISGLGIEVAVGVPEGLPFEGVLRFAFPWPGFTPCTWLTTLSRDDLIERAGAVSTAKLSEIDDALRASEQRTEWTPAAAARLSEIKDSLRRRTQADGEGTDAHADEGRSRPHDRRSAAPQQQDHDLHLHRRRLRVAVEDRVDVLHDVGAHIEEVPLVLDRDERALRAVVHRDLERLGEGPERLDVSLDAHVAEDEQRRADGRLPQRRVAATKKATPISASTRLPSRSITSTWRSEVSRSRAMPSSLFFACR